MAKDYAVVSRLIRRAHWFITLRWLAASSVVAAATCTQRVLGIRLDAAPLLVVAGTLFFYNVIFLWYARRLESRAVEAVSLREVNCFANVQISVDLAVLTYLLHCSGGVENPLLLFFVFHMIIASILLTPFASYLQATLALTLYAAMAMGELRWPSLHHPLVGFAPPELFRDAEYVLGSIGALGVTLYLTVYLTVSIAKELRTREGQLVEALDRLEEANGKLARLEEHKSRFMRVAAHQLRAPLGAITSMLKVLSEGYARQDPAKEREMALRAVSRAESMLLLLDDLLTLSRVKEARMEERERRPVALQGIVEKLVALHRPRAAEKGIRLEADLKAQDDRVCADPSAIEDAIGNLLSNAIKYTPAGGSVTVTTYERDGSVCCDVRDTGIGIPAEEIKDLFTEFYRASNARDVEREGTGLGLSIVKEILVRHGGDVSVNSEVGKGSTFALRLPPAQSRASEMGDRSLDIL